MVAAKLSEAQFVKQAIVSLRRGDYKGIHVVYSGFNTAFTEYFGKNPKEATEALQKQGVVVVRPTRGGAMLYLAEDAPQGGESALGKILGAGVQDVGSKPRLDKNGVDTSVKTARKAK